MIEVRVYREGVAEDGPVDLARARAALADDASFIWLDAIDPDESDLAAIGETFGLHPLTIEDAAHRHQRPKVELFEGYAFVAARPLSLDRMGELQERELHAFVGRRFLGTLRYGPDPPSADGARRRWERQADLLAREGGGFAAYALIDEVVDGYLTLVEEMEDQADLLEDDVFGDTDEETSQDVQQRLFRLKRDVVRLRRFATPLRQGLDFFQEEPDLAGPALQPYFRDLTEHVLRVVELADNIRDLLTSLLEVQVSQVANRLNEIMKKLSAWAGIILVPTLIAGIYGMNFREMPELGWTVGYPFALGTMALAAFLLYRMFKRRGWL
jgi:magnesium transporter